MVEWRHSAPMIKTASNYPRSVNNLNSPEWGFSILDFHPQRQHKTTNLYTVSRRGILQCPQLFNYSCDKPSISRGVVHVPSCPAPGREVAGLHEKCSAWWKPWILFQCLHFSAKTLSENVLTERVSIIHISFINPVNSESELRTSSGFDS